MKRTELNNEARCIIILCILLCIIFVAGPILHYYLHMRNDDAQWCIWYNFVSPFVAIANVIVFGGLTIAIYKGETLRQKTHEQVNIQNIIINKLQHIEKELVTEESALREGKIKVMHFYTIYISLYRYENYFKNMPSLAILKKRREVKENASQIVQQVVVGRDLFLDEYKKYNKLGKDEVDSNDCKPLAKKLNLIIAYLEEFEMSIIQDISLTVLKEPK